MNRRRTSRRDILAGAAASAAALVAAPALSQNSGPRVIVIGGGFGGADCARTLKRANARIAVTLIEANAKFSACPLANAVLAGLRPIQAQQFGYARITADNVNVVIQKATAVDPVARTVTLANGTTLGYDRLVISPGVDL